MSAPLAGQITVTGTAQQLDSSNATVVVFTIKAPRSNSLPVFVGPAGVTSSTGHQLDPGDTIDYQRQTQNGQPLLQLRPADFYVVGTGPDKVTWLASP